ncbi:unnamed protein product [Musa acuminata subsp. burmannicoides]
MASAMFYVLLLFPFGLQLAQGADESRVANITLGSYILPATNPTAWFSPSGRFALGFYYEDGGFYVGVWLQTSPGNNTVIWTAKRDDAPVFEDAMLKLTEQGLQLTQNNKEDRFITDLRVGASTASMLDSGNFIIYDANFESQWESFSLPTDTIISGQTLQAGNQLISSISETSHSSGRFRLKMQYDGNLVSYPVNTTDTRENAYWASSSDGLPVISLNLDNHGSLYLLFQNKSRICNLTNDNHVCDYSSTNTSDLGKTSNNISMSELIYRATLNVDGILQVYAHDLESNTSKVLFEIPETKDKCMIKGTCCFNSYCTSMGEKLVCMCFPGFDYIDANRTWIGCQQNLTIGGCALKRDNMVLNMSKLNNIGSVDDTYTAPFPLDTVEACSDACLTDCNCEAALFNDGSCSKQKLPLRYARRDTSDSSVMLIKVVGTNGPTGSTLIKKELSIKILCAIVAVVTGLVTAFVALGFFLYTHQVRRYKRISRKRELELVDEIALRRFKFKDLRDATDDFKQVLGKGAFGTVFKGVLPNNDRAVAIKRLEKVIDEGEREFRTEMRVIGRTHHRNLVRLLGFCDEGPHRLLVYEFMSNGSLADLIFQVDRQPSWSERTRITLDIARGIHYLHDECEASIIHCDIKPQNILMDDNWTAKISDFGLAKLLMPSQTRTFTGIRGTRGYLAPEWHKNAPITVKADVYSFGIMLLEIVCCRKNMELEAEVDEIMLLDWVYGCFVTGALENLVPDEADMTELNRLVKVGLWCIQSEPASRPNMKNVVMMLEGSIDISIPPPPTSSF